jgi:hypothetical protein
MIKNGNLGYDPETGNFHRINRAGGQPNIAGYVHKQSGYRYINYKGKARKAHRLAWLFCFGYDPKEIDHINGNRDDNRISNLREVDRRGNNQNMAKHRAGHLPGTTFRKRRKPWQAQIDINGKSKYLGSFATEKEAHEAYIRALP